jgi:hypothetical protein
MSVHVVTVPGFKYARLDIQDTRLLLKASSGRWGHAVQDLLDDDQDPVGRNLPPNVQVHVLQQAPTFFFFQTQRICMYYSGPLPFFQEAWLLIDENAL